MRRKKREAYMREWESQIIRPLTDTVGCISCKAVMNMGHSVTTPYPIGQPAHCYFGHSLRLRERDPHGNLIWERVDPPSDPALELGGF